MINFLRKVIRKYKRLMPSFLIQHMLNDDRRAMKRRFKKKINLRKLTNNKSYKFCFIILQFNHFCLTQKCVISIKKIANDTVKIIIIDNCSVDGAAEQLDKSYSDDPNILKFMNSENLSFAKGNNIGYGYAKNVLHSDFIIILNSDTEILDKRLFSHILTDYEKYRFSVLGPDIILKSEPPRHQNPMRYFVKTEKDTKDLIMNCTDMLCRLEEKTDIISLRKGYGSGKKRKLPLSGSIVLHGSFLVFSPIFLMAFDEAFDSRTFLYGEEDILALKCALAGHKMLYDGSIRIMHLGNGSMDKTDSLAYEKFRLRHTIDSARIYLKVIDESEK